MKVTMIERGFEIATPAVEVLMDDCDVQPDAWLALRKQFVGASEVAKLLGVSDYGTALDVYAAKVADVRMHADADDEASERMYWGKRHERMLVEEFGLRTGRFALYRQAMVRYRPVPALAATIDAIQLRGDVHGERPGVLELKCRSAEGLRAWAAGVPPLDVFVQVQAQMLAGQFERASVAVLFGGNRFAWCDVEPCARTQAAIADAVATFAEALAAGRPPLAAGTVRLETVKALWPRGLAGTSLTATDDQANDVRRWNDLRAARLAVEKEEKQVQAQIRAWMQEAEVALLPDGGTVTLKTVQQPAKMLSACEYRQLRYSAPK